MRQKRAEHIESVERSAQDNLLVLLLHEHITRQIQAKTKCKAMKPWGLHSSHQELQKSMNY